MQEINEFVAFLEKERNDSPHTVKAYERDLGAFAAFCQDYYGGPWCWAGVDRLAVRGFLAAQQRRGLAKRSVARALSALRTFYRFLNATRGLEVNPARAARTPKLDRTLPAYLDRAEMEMLFADAEARGAGRSPRGARSRHAGAVLLEWHAVVGARRAQRSRRRYRIRPGEGARERQEGAYRADWVPRGKGAPPV